MNEWPFVGSCLREDRLARTAGGPAPSCGYLNIAAENYRNQPVLWGTAAFLSTCSKLALILLWSPRDEKFTIDEDDTCR